MAKLQTPNTAGFNAAGNGYSVKLVKIDDIVIDPEIAGLFNISDKIKDGIVEQIKQFGYNKEEPVTLWGKILVDGRTRYTAAKEAGLKEIPAVERNFESRDDAIMYTLERQALRRNLTSAEILKAARPLLNKKKGANGTGRSTAGLAKLLGIHEATLEKAKAIVRDAPEEIIRAVENGDMSLKKGYENRNQNSASTTEKPEVKFLVNDSQSLPKNVEFLRSAVILLVEASRIDGAEIDAAVLLINHFLKKNEKRGFYDLLPETIRAQLPELPLLVQATN
jgi:ParB family chromosome partitioning protein